MLSWHKKSLSGAAMLCLWVGSQAFGGAMTPVFRYMNRAAVFAENGYLLVASFWLVLINALRAVLLYNGWFLISEGLSDGLKKPRVVLILPAVVIPVSYLCMSYFHFPLVPHFGMPALLTLLSVLLLQVLCHDVSRYWDKLIIQSVMILSTQWLDLIHLMCR